MNTFIIVSLLTAAFIVVYTLTNGIGPTPTSRKVIKALEPVLPEHIAGDIIELGAGWGNVSIFLAQKFPGQSVIAVENCPPVWLVCWLRSKLSKSQNLTVKFGNLYREDLARAGLVYCYLFPGAMEKLATQLQQAQPGCVMISNTFSLRDHEPEQLSYANDLWRSRIYRYRLSQ